MFMLKPIATGDNQTNFEVYNQYDEYIALLIQHSDFRVTITLIDQNKLAGDNIIDGLAKLNTQLQADMTQAAINLCRRGSLIQAIKIYRRYINVRASIMEAKSKVQALAAA